MTSYPSNLLFGVISTASDPIPRCAAAIRDVVIELGKYWRLNRHGAQHIAPDIDLEDIFNRPTLNAFAEQPSVIRFAVQRHLAEEFRRNSVPASCLTSLADANTHLPMSIGNYVDFYCSLEHAQNCATLVGGAVGSNFYSSPLCYNGRASSIVPSPTGIRRPWGIAFDTGTTEGSTARYGPTRKLDYELEVGYFVSRSLPHGKKLAIEDIPEYIFGFVLLNDWSSRDVQGFEMRPLGPFHSKGFGTSISPWIVPLDTLLPYECSCKHDHDITTPGHLKLGGSRKGTFNVHLKATIIRDGKPHEITRSNLRDLYWNPYQQLTHLASAGCGMVSGDLVGTGTISGEENGTRGCLFEATQDGTKPIALSDERSLSYLEDNDVVVMEGWCVNDDGEHVLSFGPCRGRVLPATQS